MGVFDSPSDTPNQLKHEGNTITLTFAPGKPVTGQGTVNWNIPAPMLGCASDSPGAYCGMVVLLSESAVTVDNAPQDGVIYEADPSADADLHAGDAINGALVVGAFYEGEKKSRGEDLTTSFVINNLDQRKSYFVVGYAVDCQGRYHRDGARAYSDNFGRVEEAGMPAVQEVALNNNDGSTLPTDGTGLTPGMQYEFEILINTEYPSRAGEQIVKVSEDGANLGTYADLVDAINEAIDKAGNIPQSPMPIDQGRYYWTDSQLYQWDGQDNQPIDTLQEPTDPATVGPGSYWYEPATDTLQVYDTPNPGWNPVDVIAYVQDPTALTLGDDFWFDGTKAYRYCTETWCEEIVNIQENDPTVAAVPTCSVYWYDETNNTLQGWNHDFMYWETVYAIEWDAPPNALNVGTYWYNDSTEELTQYDGANFAAVTFVSLNEDPVLAGVPTADGDLWYNPDTEELATWNLATTTWDPLTVLVWPEDPRDTMSCDLWWDTTTNELKKWDSVHSEWDNVGEFTQSPTDPYSAPVLEYGELWYIPSTKTMKRWDGIRWVDVTHIEYPTDPTQPAVDVAWHDTANDLWYVWNGSWTAIDPVDSPNDTLVIPQGTLWYDTTNNTLFERVGTSWIAIPFSATPYYPNHGDLWYDTTNNRRMEWVRNPDRDPSDPTSNQGSWMPASQPARAELNEGGNLVMYTTGTGTDKFIAILIPDGTEYATYDGIATGHAGHDLINHSWEDGEPLPTGTVGPDTFLFSYLDPAGGIAYYYNGADSVHALPSYEQLGVGDDGSPDERREMADFIRSQLGYPVVDVELTQKQIDQAIDFAMEAIRQRTSIAYQRSAFFLDVKPGHQHYLLTDRTVGFHKVVTVMAAYRFTSAFLSTAHGAGVYGQIVLQHLYNMGTFDLLSYWSVTQYVEQLEHLFATRLVFHWNEYDRELSFYQSFTVNERILLDVTIERTEQAILKDRWIRTWVKRYALMKAMETLSQIRGKFASLPGAGGGVSLNAADLMTKADQLKEELDAEIDDYVTNDPEDIGLHSTMILG